MGRRVSDALSHKAYCEACETEFRPRNIDEDDILCPRCIADPLTPTRGIYKWIEQDNRRRRLGLNAKRPHRATAADREALLLAQGGRCAICDALPVLRPLVVDHNHQTGEVRGLLCGDCNTGIGQLGDHPTVLRKAAEYLEQRGHYGVWPRVDEAVKTRW